MIAVWPVGATLGLLILLWSKHKSLNPELTGKERQEVLDETILKYDDAAFQRAQRKYVSAMEQIGKLKKRNKDESILGLEFFFEEYGIPVLKSKISNVG